MQRFVSWQSKHYFYAILLGLGVFSVVLSLASRGYLVELNRSEAPTQRCCAAPPQALVSSSPNARHEGHLFKSEAAGILFTYPSDWTLMPSQLGGGIEHGVTGLLPITKDSNHGPTIVVVYFENPDSLPLDQFLQKYDGSSHFIFDLSKSQSVPLPSARGYFQMWGNCDPYSCAKYIIPY